MRVVTRDKFEFRGQRRERIMIFYDAAQQRIVGCGYADAVCEEIAGEQAGHANKVGHGPIERRSIRYSSQACKHQPAAAVVRVDYVRQNALKQTLRRRHRIQSSSDLWRQAEPVANQPP
jgi:hypothetical protein